MQCPNCGADLYFVEVTLYGDVTTRGTLKKRDDGSYYAMRDDEVLRRNTIKEVWHCPKCHHEVYRSGDDVSTQR